MTIDYLKRLNLQLKQVVTLEEKISCLDASPFVERFFQQSYPSSDFLSELTPHYELVLKQLIAIGQAEHLLSLPKDQKFSLKLFHSFLHHLVAIDLFYQELGGIIGYQIEILSLLQLKNSVALDKVKYHLPQFIDLSKTTPEVDEAIQWGLQAIPQLAEIFPLGGAAHRLHLLDEITGSELPAAKLIFAGKSLLEGLIRDLQSREALYYKHYHQECLTPIVIMTSYDKNNHDHIYSILEESRWFGRPKELFRILVQPLVPVVDAQGNWCIISPLKPLLKPGGHGAIWKLAEDQGIFSWLTSLGRKKVLVRQINNPLAGLDYGLLAFTGLGYKKNSHFGFASCPRLAQAAEGMNTLIEKQREGSYEYAITNIEYCDLTQTKIADSMLQQESPLSCFSANTNILFADIEAIQGAIKKHPFPGLLLNLKKGSYLTERGEKREQPMGGLESSMQNIADVFIESHPSPLQKEAHALKNVFITYNHRHKTISTAKKAYVENGPLQETPEKCFYDLLHSHRELLEDYCNMKLPAPRTLQDYLKQGPEFLFLYHPSLGPLYSDIAKKCRNGEWGLGSELQLEIASLNLEGLNLRGSLLIKSNEIMGHSDADGILHYSPRVGHCTLRNIHISNQGVNWIGSRPFWKNHFSRLESVCITLHGQCELIAENISLKGSHHFQVYDGQRMRIQAQGEGLNITIEHLN